jgi:hypothetical protein
VSLRERLFGKPNRPPHRQEVAENYEVDLDEGTLVEIEVVGESFYQGALERIAGPKSMTGKEYKVGTTLRCEPSNPHDKNAIRVEVMGQLVGYVGRTDAIRYSPALAQHCGGAFEAPGLIVGGWRNPGSEGHYGIRVWVHRSDGPKLGLDLSPPPPPPPLVPYPTLPAPRVNETRLSPTQAQIDAGLWGSTVTVTGEEHYQAAIAAALPAGWDDKRWCPVLAELCFVPANPHAKVVAECIAVSLAGQRVGYLTPRMTARYSSMLRAALLVGPDAATAEGRAGRGEKGGQRIWRVMLVMRKP